MRTKILSLLTLGYVLSACSFLKEEQPASISNPFASEAGIEAEVRGVLKSLDSSVGLTGEIQEMVFSGSGILHWSHSDATTRLASTDWTSNLHFTAYSNHSRLGYYWGQLYSAVDRCNFILDKLPSAGVSAEYKTEIEGEVKFMRAWLYYMLVRMWGDVPLRLESTDMSHLSRPRAKYDRVYMQIVYDFTEAYQKMRTPERQATAAPAQGRPHKYAALAYLSSVYMTIGSLLNSPDDNFWDNTDPARRPDFSELGLDGSDQQTASRQAYARALEFAEMLIPESDTHIGDCPYRLASNFGDLFKWTRGYVTADGTDCWSIPERIFVYNITNEGAASVMARRTLPLFPEGTSQVSIYDGNYARTRPCRWVFQHWCEDYPGRKGVGYTYYPDGRDNPPKVTPGSKDIWVTSSDPRLDFSFYHTKYNRQDGTLHVQYAYPYQSYLVINPAQNYSMPYLKKYFSSQYNYSPGEADFYFMRLSEVYLIAAEAAVRCGQRMKAYAYMEVLHARARRSVSPEASQPIWSTDKFATDDEMVTAIFWERVYELVGESHEWYDTHRFGARWIVENISKPKNAFLNLKEQCGDADGNYIRAASGLSYKAIYYGTADKIYPEDWNEVRKGLLCEIPDSEVMYNPLIVPNDFK